MSYDALLREIYEIAAVPRDQLAAATRGLEVSFNGREPRAFVRGRYADGEGVLVRVEDSLFFVSYGQSGLGITRLDGLRGGLLTEGFRDTSPSHATSLVGDLQRSLTYVHRNGTIEIRDIQDWMQVSVEPIREIFLAWSSPVT